MTEVCINHPDNPAIEHCEVCAQPLCGYCLWYSADGRRLCERHAKTLREEGKDILPPSEYSEGIADSHLELARATRHDKEAQWLGNTQDLLAFAAVIVTITGVASMLGMYYCVPCVGGLLAVLALANASKAYDEKRTRSMAIAGLIGMVIPMMIIALLCAAYLTFVLVATANIP